MHHISHFFLAFFRLALKGLNILKIMLRNGLKSIPQGQFGGKLHLLRLAVFVGVFSFGIERVEELKIMLRNGLKSIHCWVSFFASLHLSRLTVFVGVQGNQDYPELQP